MLRTLLFLGAAAVGWNVWRFAAGGFQGRHRVESAWFIFSAIAVVYAALLNRDGVARPLQTASSRERSLILFVLAAFAIYWPALGIGLLSDDFVFRNWTVREVLSGSSWQHLRPLPLLGWKVLLPAGGEAALHAANIAVHGANAWLVARVCMRLGHDQPRATAAGALFLSFPGVVEAVAWNSGVFDVAMTAFGLLYLLSVSSPRWRALAIPFLCAALLSKETAVILPLLALLVALRTPIPTRYIVGSVLVVGLFVLVRFLLVGLEVPMAAAPLRYAVKEHLSRAFGALALPWTRGELLAYPGALVLVPVLGLLVAILISLRTPEGAAIRLRGPAWALVSTLPVFPILFIGDDLEGSRYLYLPLSGWVIFLLDVVRAVEDRIALVSVRRWAHVALTVMLVAGGCWGIRQHLESWQSAAALRDQLLRGAAAALNASGCAAGAFDRVPARSRGAYVFTNGFSEALGGASTSLPGAACHFTWNGAEFVQTPQVQ